VRGIDERLMEIEERLMEIDGRLIRLMLLIK
jgi:hypothetical protein